MDVCVDVCIDIRIDTCMDVFVDVRTVVVFRHLPRPAVSTFTQIRTSSFPSSSGLLFFIFKRVSGRTRLRAALAGVGADHANPAIPIQAIAM